MDLQKSLGGSSFGESSNGTSSSIPSDAAISSFVAIQDANGLIIMTPDVQNSDGRIARSITEDVASRLNATFLLFKREPELIHKYLSARRFSMSHLREEKIRRYRVLGHGAFGEVRAVTIKSIGFLLAQKTFTKANLSQPSERAVFLAEFACLQALTYKPSPFCLRLIAAYQTDLAYHLILPCGVGGDLAYLLKGQKQFGLDQTRFYACEIALAIGHLHKLGYLYRDLKPANVLLDSKGHCLLVDFGLAAFVGNSNGRISGRCGTPGYYPVEVMEGKEYSVDADWWAYGCVLYEMLEGVMPFDTRL
jgi:G protein-coupled receptor kinase